MQGKLEYDWRSRIIFILVIVMMGALFFSRAVLSMAVIAFTVISFFHSEPKQHTRNFLSSPLLWGMSLLFFLPLISGAWSDDKSEWQQMMLIKAPLFFLPLAFAGPVVFTKRQWEWLAFVFIGLITAASVWSMFHYVNNAAAVNEQYLRAKTMITPLENDHVRFSWLISVAVLLAGWLCFSKRRNKDAGFWILVTGASWLIIFLHILAARTGLISLYIMIAGTALWVVIKKIKWKYSIVLLIILVALPFVAYKTIPTFYNRVQYFLYDYSFWAKSRYLPGANDGVRMISIQAGLRVWEDHQLTGVGFGDIIGATKEKYVHVDPPMRNDDMIYPSSEYVMYAAGCGWPGLLIFIFVMILPLFIKTKNKLVWWLLSITAAFSLLFDPGLEVQFGVFAYAFILLWCWKWQTS